MALLQGQQVEEKTRSITLLRRLAIVLTATVLVAIWFAVTASRNMDIARSRQLAAQGANLLEENPQLTILLALEGQSSCIPGWPCFYDLCYIQASLNVTAPRFGFVPDHLLIQPSQPASSKNRSAYGEEGGWHYVPALRRTATTVNRNSSGRGTRQPKPDEVEAIVWRIVEAVGPMREVVLIATKPGLVAYHGQPPPDRLVN